MSQKTEEKTTLPLVKVQQYFQFQFACAPFKRYIWPLCVDMPLSNDILNNSNCDGKYSDNYY